MKKIAVFVVFLFIALSVSVSAQDYSALFTDGFLNGKAVMDYIDRGDMNSIDKYIVGIIDCTNYLNPGLLRSLYPEYSRGIAIDMVVKYYKDNPSELDKPIVEVLLSGCK